MSQRLQITLSEEATKQYLKLASERTEAEVSQDCEPSGARISVDIWMLMNSVSFEFDNNTRIDIGECEVELVN